MKKTGQENVPSSTSSNVAGFTFHIVLIIIKSSSSTLLLMKLSTWRAFITETSLLCIVVCCVRLQIY